MTNVKSYLALLERASLGDDVGDSVLGADPISFGCISKLFLAAIFDALDPTLSILSASVTLPPPILRLKYMN